MLKFCILPIAVIGLGSGLLNAQSVISAHSGLIHYVEGQVQLDGKDVVTKFGSFPDMKDNDVLRTADGRAEVLLTPGVFVRLAENSSIKMVSNRLSDTRVEALAGTVMIECGELLEGNAVSILYKDRTIEITKHGLYRLDADNGQFRVYDGEAVVQSAAGNVTVKHGKEAELGAAVMTAEKFDAKSTDDFYRWASRRAGYLSMANVAAAKTMYDQGVTMNTGQWAWNPWFGMFTYIPYRGVYNSPFGYGFFSPYVVYRVINPNYGRGYYNGGGGAINSYNGGARYDSTVGYNVGTRSAGMVSNSAPMSSGVSSVGASAGAGAAAASRGGSGGAGRGSSSGGGRGH
jgi:hypothetical protein